MSEVETVIKELYANQGKKLHQMCQSEMAKFGGISQKDYDDFYSRAGYEITLAKERYHPSCDKTFMDYLSGVIRFSIQKEMTARNRYKRQNIVEKEEIDGNGNLIRKKEYVQSISIDSPIEDEEGLTIADVLQSDFNIEESVDEQSLFTQQVCAVRSTNIGGLAVSDNHSMTARLMETEQKEEYSLKMRKYLGSLSKIQVKVLEHLADGYTSGEIQNMLHIDSKLYTDCIAAIKSYKNTKCIASLVRRNGNVR